MHCLQEENKNALHLFNIHDVLFPSLHNPLNFHKKAQIHISCYVCFLPFASLMSFLYIEKYTFALPIKKIVLLTTQRGDLCNVHTMFMHSAA